MYRRIMVPLDGSDRALAALGPARRLARLHVPPTDEHLDTLGYVRRIARSLEEQGHDVMDVTLQHASPPDALAGFAADVPGSLLALAIPDPDLRAGALERATAADIIRRSPVPVVVVRSAPEHPMAE
jgi:nucleotide-binding universal stress UspA family protein